MKRRLLVLEVALVLAIAAWFCSFRLGQYSFGSGDFDQIMHAKVAQEMAHFGRLLVPTLDGRPYNNKPPFKMWITAGVVEVLGESTLTYRLIDAVVGTLFFLVFFLYVRSRIPSSAGVWAAFAALLGCTQLFQAHGLRDGSQDTMLNLLLMGTLICAERGADAFLAEQRRRGMWTCAVGGLLMGMALMTKSVGALIVVPVVAAFLCLRGGVQELLRRAWRGILVAVAFSIVLPGAYWALRLSLQRGDPLRVVWKIEVMERVVKGFHNKDRAFYYLNLIFDQALAVPPLILVPALLWALYRFVVRSDRRLALPLSWAIVPVLCYSCVKSRLPWYIQFSFPGMAMLVGYAFAAALDSAKKWRSSGRSGRYTQGIVALGSLAFVLACCWQISAAVWRNALRVAAPQRIIPVERVVRLLQPGLTFAEGSGKVFSAIPKKLSLREERFYWEMIGNKPLRISKLTEVLKNPDIRIAIAELQRLPELARIRRPLGYTLVHPYKKRTNWNVAMYFDERELKKLPSSDLVRSDETAECKLGLGEGFSGFSQPRPYGDELGCLLKRGSVAHPSPGRGGVGAVLRYDVALADPSHPVVVSAYLGQRLLGTAEVRGPETRTIEFRIPPGVRGRSARHVELKLQDNAGAPIRDSSQSLVFYRLRTSLEF